MKTVILAAGLGTRMRRDDGRVHLDRRQAEIAQTGIKALIPIDRPFLDYVLSGLADAGLQTICLVIGPHHDQLRQYYEQLPLRRITIDFAVQPQPLGTAHALACAEPWAGDDPFVVLNSDNYYPHSALKALALCEEPALIGFDRDALVAESNISAERVARFAVIQADEQGYLRQIIEKPDPDRLAAIGSRILVSMNCWRFSPEIFSACRHIEKSPRGEYELPDAVSYGMEHLGCRYRVIPCREGVLDLSSRQDVEPVARRLGGLEVNL